MEWTDDAVLLAARPFGEAEAIATVLSRTHGRVAGLVRGGASRRQAGLLQPGTRLRATWTARLSDQLGRFAFEPLGGSVALMLDRRLPLAALSAACAVAATALPEREPHAGAHDGLLALIAALAGPAWAPAYVAWELALLAELGFGLDLANCALTGGNDDLAYVSPRTGRAVSRVAGEAWRERLLVLPGFLAGRGLGAPEEVVAGLALTGHFLGRHVYAALHQPLPPARHRLADLIEQASRADPGAALE